MSQSAVGLRRLRREQKGSLIVAALLLFVILLALGMGLMSAQAARTRVARAQTESAQARALALAAWEDVQAKLAKDALFPPVGESQTFYSYSEDVYDGAQYYGNYTVIIDMRWHSVSRDSALGNPSDPSYESEIFESQSIYPITCIGKLAPARVGDVTSERVLYFELDMKDWRVRRVEDRGSF